jgi:methyltransferase (TIGR00027 family)
MDHSQIDAIGRTAFEVAALRAAEHRRPDRLFADPYAEMFLGAAGIDVEPDPIKDEFVAIMDVQAAVRTRFLDDTLLARTSGERQQVVLLASGMDSRGYRLDWPPGTELFEIDQGPVLRFKQQVLHAHSVSPRAAIHPVEADLRGDWPARLRRAGYRTDQPAAWLAEGLLYALDETAADRLLGAITELSSPGSTIAFDHIQHSATLHEALTKISADLASLWQSGPKDPEEWLRRHGWEPEVHELATVARSHGRSAHPAYDPATGDAAHAWLVRATRH